MVNETFSFFESVDRPGEHQSVNNDVLEWWFSKQRCGEDQQGVEPRETRTKSGETAKGRLQLPQSIHSSLLLYH